MRISPSEVKVLKTEFENQILSEDWLTMLLEDGLYIFEQQLYQSIIRLYDSICETLIKTVSLSSKFIKGQKEIGKEKGLKKLVSRPVELQLRTGTKIKFDSLYAKIAPQNYTGSRHLSMLFWQLDMKCSPMYQSIICLLSVVCPSFEISKDILRYMGIHANFDLSLIHI